MLVKPPVYFRSRHPLKPASALPSSLLLIALAVSHAVQAGGYETQTAAKHTTDYQIRPQSLDKALVDYSLKSGVQVVADGKLTAGVSSQGVSGRYAPQQALQMLLAGTGVAVQSSRDGMVTLQKVAQTVHAESIPSQSTATLPKVRVIGKIDEADEDSEYANNTSYKRTNALSATKTDTPIMETPISVQTVTRAVMNDQQAIKLEDAVKMSAVCNVAAVLAMKAACTITLSSVVLIRSFPISVTVSASRIFRLNRLMSSKWRC